MNYELLLKIKKLKKSQLKIFFNYKRRKKVNLADLEGFEPPTLGSEVPRHILTRLQAHLKLLKCNHKLVSNTLYLYLFKVTK